MTNPGSRLPFFAKASIFLLGLFAFVSMLYIAQSIIVPLILSVFTAILLHPVVNFFVRRKINRVIAIVITISLTVILIAASAFLLISQAIQFSESWPLLVDKFTVVINESISWISGYFDINPRHVHTWVNQTKSDLLNISGERIGQTLLSVGSGIVMIFLLPVYIFLLLYYHPLLIEFIHRLFAKGDQGKVNEIIKQVKTVIQRYLAGLVIEAVIVAILNSVALLALGVEYAILLGIIGAMLNVIPYIGGLVAVALPMMIALATSTSPITALYVLILYYIIQLIDNNFIVPYIVASKVKINALFSIIVVLAGNALWGLTGMFLSIPLLAIIKLIFDHLEGLKPWGFLLGDTMPPIIGRNPILKRIKKII
jgi:predicted PurR-regulated permease PerM